MGGRHYYIGQSLAKLGYQVYVIDASYNHLLTKPVYFDEKIKIEKRQDSFNFAWLKIPMQDKRENLYFITVE